jgi:hypothetical protein
MKTIASLGQILYIFSILIPDSDIHRYEIKPFYGIKENQMVSRSE